MSTAYAAQPGTQAKPSAGAKAQAHGGSNVFGADELPKGLTIVPWKKSKPGDLSSGPTRLVDEPLQPIDPKEFQRRLKYYQQAKGN